MSHTYRDGRGGRSANGHKEIWSRRCKRVTGDACNRFSKRITHRIERRQARLALKTTLTEDVADA